MDRDARRILYVQTTGTESPERSATVFFLAASAAALDIEVGIYFTQFGPTLLQRGVPKACTAYRMPKPSSSTSDFRRKSPSRTCRFPVAS